jgi:hypothetical protein
MSSFSSGLNQLLGHACLYFGFSWLELVALGLSRTQFWAQLGHFEGISGLLWKLLYARKPFSDAGFVGAGDGNRTHTLLTGLRILRSRIRKSARH